MKSRKNRRLRRKTVRRRRQIRGGGCEPGDKMLVVIKSPYDLLWYVHIIDCDSKNNGTAFTNWELYSSASFENIPNKPYSLGLLNTIPKDQFNDYIKAMFNTYPLITGIDKRGFSPQLKKILASPSNVGPNISK